MFYSNKNIECPLFCYCSEKFNLCVIGRTFADNDVVSVKGLYWQIISADQYICLVLSRKRNKTYEFLYYSEYPFTRNKKTK